MPQGSKLKVSSYFMKTSSYNGIFLPRIYIEVDNKFAITDLSQRHKFANINNSNNNFGIILNGLTL